MTTATLSITGQVTIPAAVRAALGLHAGDRIDFIELEKGQFAIVAATKSVSDLEGLLKKPVKPVSIEGMNKAIATTGAGAA
ncbi:AbrB/MazE/SpoVT family DNA-binding domain-containing protein [Chitinimonas arctica]|uniref:AbrB/MazE/SpoVT family DNA-binding domain-containing protein n=1 Tax=Chitinimonas arctica TaxID=2594795 RepID=A0A516SFJ7_9NEIS|nr:AbrB/MazE/SpoVT family DNA-binding domain-containing protein [Chitinimonas arctica]QDQ26912.1 AbrB/MazE/SpoVT family DNA-binding domain-containing protein [Chitinimonas arctica]